MCTPKVSTRPRPETSRSSSASWPGRASRAVSATVSWHLATAADGRRRSWGDARVHQAGRFGCGCAEQRCPEPQWHPAAHPPVTFAVPEYVAHPVVRFEFGFDVGIDIRYRYVLVELQP